MALPYKQDKVALVIKEMVNTGAEYEINGIDTTKAIFMWRKDQKLYEPIPTSSYTVDKTSSDVKLIITDLDTLKDIERLQIISVINDTSSKYEPLFKVDIDTLKNSYNELAENFKSLFNYVKKTVMIADGQDFSIVLPTLNEGEVWVKTIDGWRGFYIGDIEIQVKELRELIENSRVSAIQDIENKRDSSLESIEEEGTTQVNKVKDEGTTQTGLVTDEGTTQVNKVKTTGDTQNTRITDQGDTQVNKVTETGDAQNERLTTTGNTENERLETTGDTQNTRITDQGDTQSNRLNAIDNQASTKFDLIQRMMSVVVGANRWLDGGNIELRDISLSPERIADGGDIRQRTGNPRRIYDAGDITQRVVDIPLDIDLGSK